MNTLDLLEKHPKATIVVKQWFLERMIESFKDETVPEDFKDYMKQQGIDTSRIASMVSGNPRILFSVLDEQHVYVQVTINLQNLNKPAFTWSINGKEKGEWYENRVEAEKQAIVEAFKTLEEKL
jgi:hypothetical protein